MDKQIEIFEKIPYYIFSSCNFFLSSKLWIRIGIQRKMLDQDPEEMNLDLKHYLITYIISYYEIALLCVLQVL